MLSWGPEPALIPGVLNASPRRSDPRLLQAPRACHSPCPRPSAPRRHLTLPARSPSGPGRRARFPGRGESEGGRGGRRGAGRAGRDAEGRAGLRSLQPPLRSRAAGGGIRDPARRRRARRGPRTISGAPPPEQLRPPATAREPQRLVAREDLGSGELGHRTPAETWAAPGECGASGGADLRACGRR